MVQWKQEACNCFEDQSICSQVCCCSQCMLCALADGIANMKAKTNNKGAIFPAESNMMMELCCLCYYPACAILKDYMEVRDAYGIENNGAFDMCIACCCPSCALCQIFAEFKQQRVRAMSPCGCGVDTSN